MKCIYMVASLLLTVSNVFAEIPHTFTANTPAKASEVNANFEYLDNKLSTSEQTQGDNCIDNHIDLPYSYSRQEAPLGTVLTVGETEYRLVKVLVTDTLTNEEYHVTYPVTRTLTREDNTPFVYFSLPIFPVYDTEYLCDSATISGAKTYNNKNIGFIIDKTQLYSNVGEDSAYKNYSSERLKFSTFLGIGNQVLQLSFQGGYNSESTLVDPNDYDFTDDNVPVLSDFSTTKLEISNLLDHIIIEKITQ